MLTIADIDEPCMKLDDAARISGASKTNVRTWVTKGQIYRIEKKNDRSKRKYSLGNGISFAIMQHLSDAGMKPSIALLLARGIYERFVEFMHDEATMEFLNDGVTFSVDSTGHELMVFGHDGKQVSWNFYPRPVVADFFMGDPKTYLKNPITRAFRGSIHLNILEADYVIYRVIEEYRALKAEMLDGEGDKS